MMVVGQLQQTPAEQQADRQAADVAEEDFCDRPVEGREAEHGAAQCRSDHRSRYWKFTEQSEHDHRACDRHHFGDRHQVETVHEVDEVNEPQACQQQQAAFDPERSSRDDPGGAGRRIEDRGDARIVPAAPLWIERGLLLLAGLWFVNLVNFMDGLDLMTVAEVVPITGAMVVLGLFGEFPVAGTVVAAALCGAMLGFAPFNRPVAKVFLGDVGSLPIGLLLGWCLLQLAYQQQFAAALLLPLYYLFDATATLLRRLARGEPFWAAHRTHFYQRATDNGFTVWRVVSEVFALNVGLAVLAVGSIMTQPAAIKIAFVVIGACGVGLTMFRFSRPRPA